MYVRNYMSRKFSMCSPDDNLRSAALLMRNLNINALPVGDKAELYGMITDRDIIHALADGALPDTPIQYVMRHQLCYCFEDETPEDAAEQMKELNLQLMPVINQYGELAGIVSLADLSQVQSEERGSLLKGQSEQGGAPT
jgi:CBS domain-containing protein